MAPEAPGTTRAAQWKERARRAYELGRARRAAIFAAPILALPAIAGAMAPEPAAPYALGALLYVVAALCAYLGRDLARGVLPGVAAGFVPFALVHAARAYGHVCTGSGCMSLCLPACVAGGLAAGAAFAYVVRRRRSSRAAWISAGLVASLTGSLACTCVGLGGVAGLLAGILVGAAPFALRPASSGA